MSITSLSVANLTEEPSHVPNEIFDMGILGPIMFFFNAIKLTISTTTFSKLCETYTVACRRVFSSAPL
jgi:hypothetical protein